MSSDGSETSTGSRIRQFGLYRTIDARTDEFLKSSRKRQIRQGCACAAISTAITVTVVISVILVYEYTINSETNGNKQIIMKPNWFGKNNESKVTQLETILTKKSNLDKTTLKLLPILIKALNKNRYLEKLLNEYSSSSPAYETGDTESYFKKNIFSDSKNWLKSPSMKLYTTDYKTPLIYLQNPTKRLDYLSRIRKIRNYERILNYFDKMVNEKVDNSKTEQRLQNMVTQTLRPLKTTFYTTRKNKFGFIKNYTNQNISATNLSVNRTKTNFNNTTNHKNNTTKQNNFNKTTNNCNCPKNLGQILKKILQGIQNLMPDVIGKQQSKTLCPNKTQSKSYLKHIQKTLTTQKIMYKPQNTALKATTQKIVTKPTKHTVMINLTTEMEVSTKPYTTHSTTQYLKIPTSTVITSKPTDIASKPTSSKSITYFEKLTTEAVIRNSTKILIKDISSESNKETTTILPKISTIINPFFKHSSPRTTTININNSNDSRNDSYTVKIPENHTEVTTIPNAHIIDTANHETGIYTDITTINESTTPINLEFAELRGTTELIVPYKSSYVSYDESSASPDNTFDSVAVVPNYKHPIEPLFKDEMYDDQLTTPHQVNHFSNRIRGQFFKLIKTNNVNQPATEYLKSEPNNLRNNMRKMGLKSANYHPVIRDQHLNMRKMSDLAQIPNLFFDDEGPSSTCYTPIYKRRGSKIGNKVRVNSSISNKSLIQNFINSQESVVMEDKSTKTPNIDNENTENLGEDEFLDQLITYRPEVTEANYRKTDNLFNDDEQAQEEWDKIKSDDKINNSGLKSMLPPVRPIYLEVRRNNDWKSEPPSDYDVNLANNIFDLP